MEITDITLPEPVFNPHMWIKCGKKYPEPGQIPLELRTAVGKLLKIPTRYQQMLPNPTLPVTKFIAIRLPIPSSDLIWNNVGSAFSELRPNDPSEFNWLLTCPIPSLPYIHTIKAALGQKWLDGAISFTDSQFKNSRECLPFWLLTWWEELLGIIKIQNEWRDVVAWISRGQRGKDSVYPVSVIKHDNAHELLDSLPWNNTVSVFDAATNTSNFTLLLSNKWLDSVLLDMMVSELELRCQLSDLKKSVILRTTMFHIILKEAATTGHFDLHVLKSVISLVQESGRTRLYFIYNMNNVHWIPFEVDFTKKEIRYGDSMGYVMERPITMVKAIQKWLKAKLGVLFQDKGDTLPHGIQNDTHSCGVCSVNAIDHALFNTVLWTPRNARMQRIDWFITISTKYLQYGFVHDVDEKPDSGTRNVSQENIPNLDLDTPGPNSQSLSLRELNTETDTRNEDNEVAHTDVSSYTSSPVNNPTQTDTLIEISTELKHSEIISTKSSDTTVFWSNFKALGCNKRRDRSPEHGMGVTVMSKQSQCNASGRSGKKIKLSSLSSSETDDSEDDTKLLKKNRSSIYAQGIREAVATGTFVINEERLASWKKKITLIDSHALCNEKTARAVHHVKCGQWIYVDLPYATSRFRKHVQTCSCKRAAGMLPVTSYFQTRSKKSCTTSIQEDQAFVCPGITKLDEPRIEIYLQRSGAEGGGSVTVGSLANELFGVEFSKLNKKQQKSVRDHKCARNSWVNDHRQCCAHATDCQKYVKAASSEDVEMCSACTKIRKSKAFKGILIKPMPQPANLKFLNKEYLNEPLAQLFLRTKGLEELFKDSVSENVSVFTKFIKAALRGDFNTNTVFLGAVEAMTLANERFQKGLGLQNMKYQPEFDEFAHQLVLTSPQAYSIFKHHFRGRTHRSFRKQRSTQRSFPIGLNEQCFDLAHDFLKTLQYSGPLALSCDDTKLLDAFRMYYDGETQKWFLIGQVEEPLHIANPDDLQRTIKSANLSKATKLRLWCLQIPLPQVPPIILAAKAISNNSDAETLFGYTKWVLDGLWKRGLNVVSYASDGTEVERSVQRLLVAKADDIYRHFIPHPRNMESMCINIPLYSGRPIIPIQDSKHGLKTFRNNLFSGARLLVLGNYTATYQTIHSVAFAEGSPLYHRDVVKLDRQDDHAAVRLFSAAVLEHIAKHTPDNTGEIIYLFLFGELIDAYQNRWMNHLERIHIALRTQYFLDIWQAFLAEAKYPKTRYFLSRESRDILHFLIHNLIALIICYRDFINRDNSPIPCLPWLHSTETCEHSFAAFRMVVKDFTYRDFLYSVPKVRVLMRSGMLQGTNFRGTASGYVHTWSETSGTDLLVLSTYPSNSEIANSAEKALKAAENLFAFLDIAPPSIQGHVANHGWLSFGLPSDPSTEDLDDNDDGNDFDDFENSERSDSEAAQLQALLDASETWPLGPVKETDRITSLAFAAVSANMEDMAQIQNYEDETETMLREESEYIHVTLANCNGSSSPAKRSAYVPYTSENLCEVEMERDYRLLIQLRQEHETVHARSSAKKQMRPSKQDSSSHRLQIIREFESILREQQARGAGTGIERKTRWTVQSGLSVPVGTSTELKDADALTGNAANAAHVA